MLSQEAEAIALLRQIDDFLFLLVFPSDAGHSC